MNNPDLFLSNLWGLAILALWVYNKHYERYMKDSIKISIFKSKMGLDNLLARLLLLRKWVQF